MKKYAHLIIIAVLSAVTVLGLLRLGKIDISLDTLLRVNGWWLLLAFITFYLSIVARGLRWQHILSTMDRPVPTLYAQTLLTAGLFISSILPARAGDIGRVTMLKQDHKIPISQGVASLAAERALDVFAVLVLALIGALLALPGRVPSEVLQLMVVTGVLLVMGLVGLLAIPSLEGWLRQPGWLWRRIPQVVRPFYEKVVDFGFALVHGVRDLAQKPLALAAIVAESFGIWLLDALIVHLVLFSLNLHVPFSVSLVSSMVGVLATIVPLMPGALGQFEAGVISVLTLLSVSTADSSLTALLVRFISLWSFIPVSGLITYIFGFSRALSLSSKTPETEEAAGVKSAVSVES